MKIMYIEDDPGCVELVGHILRMGGHKMFSANNAKTGLALAYREVPDLILMDLHLPRVNGAQAVELLKSSPKMRNIPVIAVTANKSEANAAMLMNAGCSMVVFKPFTPKQILKAIETVMGVGV